MNENHDEVATHVLISAEAAEKLKALSRKTRVTQSEYLREAVDDLLRKYAAERAREMAEELASNA